MTRTISQRWGSVVISLLMLALLVWPTANGAQGNRITFSGQATAVRGTVFGAPVVKSDTGPLPNSGGAREASLLLVSIPRVLTAEVLHASTIGQGDRSRSEAVIANVTAPGNSIFIEFLRAWAMAVCAPGGPSVSGGSEITGLVANGQPIFITGEPNQTIILPNGRIIINEQVSSLNNRTGEITVNALHVIITGTADVVICSAHADITCRGKPAKGTGDFVTGGGWITGTPSGAKANFSVAGGISHGAFWGHLTYIDHGSHGPRVEGTGVTAYVVVNPRTRQIKGTAKINGQGGFTYQVDVSDNGEPGRNDTFMLRLSNGYIAWGNLGGGNIQVYQP